MDGVTIVAVTTDNSGILDHLDPTVFDEPIVPGRLARCLDEANHRMFVAVEDGEVIGMCTAMIHFHADKPDELYVDEVGVADKALRRGIGTALLKAMLDWGKAMGCAEAWLATEPDNEPALSLYRAFGPVENERCVYFLYDLGS